MTSVHANSKGKSPMREGPLVLRRAKASLRDLERQLATHRAARPANTDPALRVWVLEAERLELELVLAGGAA